LLIDDHKFRAGVSKEKIARWNPRSGTLGKSLIPLEMRGEFKFFFRNATGALPPPRVFCAKSPEVYEKKRIDLCESTKECARI